MEMAEHKGLYCFNAKVDLEIATTCLALSSLGTVFIIVVLWVYSRCEEIKWITKRSSRLIFFYVTLLSLLAILLYKDDYKYINFVFIVFMVATSTVIIIWGSFQFFRQCATEVERLSIVREQSNLSTFIVVITVILTVLEILIIIGSALDGDVWNCLLFGSGTIQKTIQVFVYHCRLRYLMAREDRLSGAAWYYITIALVNLVLWNEAIEATNDEQTKYMKSVLQGAYSIFAKAYTGLIVDYRLICCILFVEHALEIEKVQFNQTDQAVAQDAAVRSTAGQMDDLEQTPTTTLDTNHSNSHRNKNSADKFIVTHRSFEECESFKNSARTNSGAGFMLGLLVIFLQILNGMVYSGNNAIGSWANIMGCIAMWSFVLCGCIFLRKVQNLYFLCFMFFLLK